MLQNRNYGLSVRADGKLMAYQTELRPFFE